MAISGMRASDGSGVQMLIKPLSGQWGHDKTGVDLGGRTRGLVCDRRETFWLSFLLVTAKRYTRQEAITRGRKKVGGHRVSRAKAGAP